MAPLVSVIIPCYNASATIRETVESVLAQSYRSIEIVVVDDGSVDGSGELAGSLDPLVRVIRQPNGGPAHARNTGIRSSSGDLVAFLDSDDLWLPNKLEVQVAAALAGEGDTLLFMAVERRHPDGRVEFKGCELPDGGRLSYQMLWRLNCITTSTVLAPRQLLLELLFDEDPGIQGAEDYDLWLRIAEHHPVRYLGQALAIYRVSPQGHNRSNLERSFAAVGRMYRKQESAALEQGIAPAAQAAKRFTLDKLCGIRLFRVGDTVRARVFLARARSVRPLDPELIYYSLLTLLPDALVAWLRRSTRWRPTGD